jgi:hypothetical protein
MPTKTAALRTLTEKVDKIPAGKARDALMLWSQVVTNGVFHRGGAGPFVVSDAKGMPVAYVPCRGDLQGVRFAHNHLTSRSASDSEQRCRAVTFLKMF